MRPDVLTAMLVRMAHHKPLRRILLRQIDKQVYKGLVNPASPDPEMVQLRRYQYLSAMLHCVARGIDKGIVSPQVVERIVDVFVRSSLIGDDQGRQRCFETFQAKYGQLPPTFIVVSPTQRCNLQCIGCYADSSAHQAATLPYELVDRVLSDAHDIFGCRFITISGGEPLLYRSNGKTLLDLFRKYNDIFFLFYTNGTLIDQETAKVLHELGNVTPAISVEGYQEQTDGRRGKGVFKRILDGLEQLRRYGVPFGISVTATSQNADLLSEDRFYEYYFEQEGACYMWMFQLMPIGRGQDELSLMVSPEKRVQLFRQWERMLAEKRYCVADFWNSGVLAKGCIAYGRSGGYIYVDWHGHVTPCVFIPYYVDTVQELYAQGKTLADALFSEFMIRGRQWQNEYGLANPHRPGNWLMPCSIRDHYDHFRGCIVTADVRPQDQKAMEGLQSEDFHRVMCEYDRQLEELTSPIWQQEYLQEGKIHQPVGVSR